MENKKLLQTVAKKMKDRDPKQIKILMGFDGFVEIGLHVVVIDMMQNILNV